MSTPMTAHFLARWLLDQEDLSVQVETEGMICPLVTATTDCFDPDEGTVVLLVPDLTDKA